jgi:hypothetical protein
VSRATRAVAGASLACAALWALVGPVEASPAAEPPPTAPGLGRVLVVSFPRSTWERVVPGLESGRLPHLSRFLGDAALASMSTRTVGPVTDPGKAYLSLGAGNRADPGRAGPPGEAADAGEETPTGTAAEVFRRRTGTDPTGAVLSLNFGPMVERNEELLFGTRAGAMASALRSAGRTTAVVGNADTRLGFGASREVALAGADPTGQVAAGTVGPELLVADPDAPFGVRSDPDRLRSAALTALAEADVVVVEASDLERSEQAGRFATPEQAAAWRDEALVGADELLGSLLAEVDPARDLVFVLGPTPPLGRAQLALFAVRGPGFDGDTALSSTTRRPAYVTLTDVAPTALRFLGVPVPTSMNDTPISTRDRSGSPPEVRAAAFAEANDRAVARERALGPVHVAYIVLLVLSLVGALIVLTRRHRHGHRASARSSAITATACTTVMAVPPVAYLLGMLPGPLPPPAGSIALTLLAALVVALVLWPLRRLDPIGPPLAAAALSVLVLGVDIVSGAHLQIDTIFGYSPIVAGRFAGFGNQAYAVWSITGLIVLTGGWELWERRRPDSQAGLRVAAFVTGSAVLVVLDGAPQFGSDVGGVLATVPALAICGLLLTGRRVRPLMVAVIAAGTVVLLGLFAALDLSRPADSRTHLGRFAQRLLDGEAGVIFERKLNANLGILTSTVWTLVLPVALAFIAYLAWRPGRVLVAVERRHRAFRAFEVSALVMGVLAWALNDSGILVPAMMLSVALPYTAYLALDASAAEGPEGPEGPVGEPEAAA